MRRMDAIILVASLIAAGLWALVDYLKVEPAGKESNERPVDNTSD